MRIGIFGIILLTITFMAAAPTTAEIRYKTGFHLDRWESDAGEKGIQYHIPLEISSTMGDFSFKVLSAYAYNDVDLADSEVESFSGLVDTRVNLAYEFVDKWPVDVLFALDFSLPTGQTRLSAIQALSISDPDKVTITRMGEGLNINPNVSIVKQWDALMASVGIGYLIRGKYDAADTLENYDPGDPINIAAQVDYSISDQWLVRIFGSHTWFEKDRQDGADYFEPGDVRIIGTGIVYTIAQWQLAGTYKSIQRDKNKLTVGFSDLTSEEHNSYGEENIAELSGRLRIDDRMNLRLWLQYLTLAENDYPPTSAFYTSDRAKIALGAEIVRRLAKNWEAGLRLQHFHMSVDPNPADANDTDFDGDTVAVWIAAQF